MPNALHRCCYLIFRIALWSKYSEFSSFYRRWNKDQEDHLFNFSQTIGAEVWCNSRFTGLKSISAMTPSPELWQSRWMRWFAKVGCLFLGWILTILPSLIFHHLPVFKLHDCHIQRIQVLFSSEAWHMLVPSEKSSPTPPQRPPLAFPGCFSLPYLLYSFPFGSPILAINVDIHPLPALIFKHPCFDPLKSFLKLCATFCIFSLIFCNFSS